jgi:hypothetical protein
MISNIFAISRDCVPVNVICPNDLVASPDQSQIQAASAAEQRQYSHQDILLSAQAGMAQSLDESFFMLTSIKLRDFCAVCESGSPGSRRAHR